MKDVKTKEGCDSKYSIESINIIKWREIQKREI
jgi:hypothetical protein